MSDTEFALYLIAGLAAVAFAGFLTGRRWERRSRRSAVYLRAVERVERAVEAPQRAKVLPFHPGRVGR